MSDSRIQDIPKIKKLLSDIKMMRTIQTALPIIEPLLRQFGIDTSKMKDALAGIDELERQIDLLASIPERFNNIFAQRGWIMYDLLNMEVAKAVLSKAEQGDIDGAELDLANYYTPDTVKWKLQTLISVKAFRPRIELAKKALEDYQAGRYYASILVILSLTDGLVSELSKDRRGFAASDVDLRAWDSIAAHSTGLNVLAGIFQVGRRTLRTESITIPYRNGIMHGMDLGYDNQLVAAKVWAALFAVRDWALKVEKGEVTPPPQTPEPTLQENLRTIQEVIQSSARLKSWEPRGLIPGENIPASGTPDEYEDDSPEQVLIEFLSAWKSRNYGKMSQYLTHSDRKYYGQGLPRKVRQHYEIMSLVSYQIIEFVTDAANVAIIRAKIVWTQNGTEKELTHDFNMLFEDGNGKPSTRGTISHKWVIYNAYV